MHSILYSVYWRAFDISVCYDVLICEYEHHWWFACYLCVGAVPCVCWRGVWEGHHCGRIIMVIAPKMPFLSASVYLYHIQYHPFLFSSVPSCEDFNVFFFPPVCSLNVSLLLHTTLGTSDTHHEYHHRNSSIFRIETRELLVLLKSEFQMAVVSCTVALEVGLKQQVWGMEKALMEIKQATEHEILKMQICNEFNSILCVLYDPGFCCALLWSLTAASVVSA